MSVKKIYKDGRLEELIEEYFNNKELPLFSDNLDCLQFAKIAATNQEVYYMGEKARTYDYLCHLVERAIKMDKEQYETDKLITQAKSHWLHKIFG